MRSRSCNIGLTAVLVGALLFGACGEGASGPSSSSTGRTVSESMQESATRQLDGRSYEEWAIILGGDPEYLRDSKKSCEFLSYGEKGGAALAYIILERERLGEGALTALHLLESYEGDLDIVLPAVFSALSDDDRIVRYAALETLEQLAPRSEAAAKRILAAFPENDDLLRLKLIGLLGSMGADASAAVPLLEETLHDPSSQVRGAARKALDRIRE